jgi:hypothetical protein
MLFQWRAAGSCVFMHACIDSTAPLRVGLRASVRLDLRATLPVGATSNDRAVVGSWKGPWARLHTAPKSGMNRHPYDLSRRDAERSRHHVAAETREEGADRAHVSLERATGLPVPKIGRADLGGWNGSCMIRVQEGLVISRVASSQRGAERDKAFGRDA